MKKFNEWNEVKKQIDQRKEIIKFKERDIYWISIGENVGFEQNGKGKEFARPVLIIKKLNKQLFFGIPLSSTIREGSYFYTFAFTESQKSSALLVQAKVFDIKRANQKLGMINQDDFKNIKEKLGNLFDL
ncbi:type II toxin-antitoxin system PemK/MazF family toxin [Arcobacteraceae bacterium]|nr:type II toxin-antitoxin system PemK/MazF family toxin [Arcobacteraceae bacterium]